MCPVEPARFQAENHGKKHVEEWNLSRGKNAKRLFPRSRTKTHEIAGNKTWKRTKAKKRTEMTEM